MTQTVGESNIGISRSKDLYKACLVLMYVLRCTKEKGVLIIPAVMYYSLYTLG